MSRIVFAVASTFLLGQSAFAQGKKEWVFVPYMGSSRTMDSKLTLERENTRLEYASVRWRDESLRSPWYYGMKAVYWPSEDSEIGYSIDLIHYKVFADTSKSTRVSGTLNGSPYNQTEPIRNTLGRFSISHGVNFIGANVIRRHLLQRDERFPSGRFHPYCGVGAGIVINHPESNIDGEYYERWQFGGFSWQLFLGAEYRLDRKLGLFAEYKYTDYTPRVDTAQGGEGEARLRTHHLALGTTVRIR